MSPEFTCFYFPLPMSLQTLISLFIATPGVLFLLLGITWLLGGHVSERAMSRISNAIHASLAVAVVIIARRMWQGGMLAVHVSLGDWFTVAEHGFPLSLVIDKLSLPFVGMTVVLASIVGSFSVRYLHRDPGFFRFFTVLHLFTFGALLVFTAGSLDLLIVGWEIVGITSALLIAFFQFHPEPVRNALRVFSTCRVADVFLLSAVLLSHHWFGPAAWTGWVSGDWSGSACKYDDSATSVIAVLLAFAASGKSSLGPFCGWLPRAMEGPTPASAVLYAAIAVHAGAYLLLRAEPLIHHSVAASSLIIFMGLTTAFFGTLIHRTCADGKTSLACAAQTQLGLIFAEIGFGWTTLAVIHMVSHAMLRTLEFLRAPSRLRDCRRVHPAASGRLNPTGGCFESLLPAAVQLWLYRLALTQGIYDVIMERWVIAPVQTLARWLAIFEPGFPHRMPDAGLSPAAVETPMH